MKSAFLLLVFVIGFCFLASSSQAAKQPMSPISRLGRENAWASDGTGCAVCVFALTEVERLIKEHSGDIAKLLEGVCKNIPNEKLSYLCSTIAREFGSEIIIHLLKKEQPDWVCSKLKLCKQCHLIQPESSRYFAMNKEQRMRANLRTENPTMIDRQYKARIVSAVMEGQLIQQYFNTINSTKGDPKAATIDLDKDGFSPAHTGRRSADWKGRDCNDLASNVKPYLKQSASDILDTNCNGINGKNTQNEAYEDMFCNSFENDRNLILFGDSATAGFSIPKEWIDLKNMTDILPMIVNEFDHPELSWGTGWAPELGPSSVYLIMRKMNRCAHRQFANLGVNGAVGASLLPQVQQAPISPDMKPFLAFVGYIGNDVCKKTLPEMTKPEDFEQQMLAGLAALDKKIPPKSKVVLFGLVNGAFLYETMKNVPHPMSSANENITYADFYQFLDCTGVNPCNTWLTSDDAERAAATQRAEELDDVVKQIVLTKKFNNFDLAYIDFEVVLEQGLQYLERAGIPPHELIDDMDGFHPSLNYGHRVLSSVIFTLLPPDFVGTVNPNNDQIQALFGDQGGY